VNSPLDELFVLAGTKGVRSRALFEQAARPSRARVIRDDIRRGDAATRSAWERTARLVREARSCRIASACA